MYFILFIAIAVASYAVQSSLKSKFSTYSKTPLSNGMTGAQVAEKMLRDNGINNVKVTQIEGQLTDHYNPATLTVNLSRNVYYGSRVAAAAVAAHECGHAMQDNEGYAPLRFRSALVPVANFGSSLSWPLILLGLVFGGLGSPLVEIGILMFSLAVLFQLVTLPVEFNASSRALHFLNDTGMLSHEELRGTRKVLKAAALTYVASAAAAILQLLRLVLLFGGRDRD